MAAYLVALVLIVFWPTPVDRLAVDGVKTFIAWMHRRGVPTFVGYGKIEFAANIALFVPMGIIASTWTKKAWAGVLVEFAASVGIEIGQALFLAERFASVFDVLANLLGAVIGAALYFLCHRHHQKRLVVLAGDENRGL